MRWLFGVVTLALAAAAACTSSSKSEPTLARAALLKPETCKTCQQDHFRVSAVERAFSEWQGGVCPHGPGGSTCGQCHMSQSANLEPVAQAPNVFARRRHVHTFEGVDVALTPFPEVDVQKKAVKAFLDTTL